jgi:glycosyltransferase involved in cell wall biosynthesis
LIKTTRHLNVLTVGHLRGEKSPETIFATARLMRDCPSIRFRHIGGALAPALGEAAEMTMRDCPHYRWLGQRPHAATRQAIQRAHLLVHPSRMEGGAHAIIEAIVSGTPVLASAVDGNIGLLGADYPGYFPWGDAAALAARLSALQADGGHQLAILRQACQARAPLFAPERERQAVQALAIHLSETK